MVLSAKENADDDVLTDPSNARPTPFFDTNVKYVEDVSKIALMKWDQQGSW